MSKHIYRMSICQVDLSRPDLIARCKPALLPPPSDAEELCPCGVTQAPSRTTAFSNHRGAVDYAGCCGPSRKVLGLHLTAPVKSKSGFDALQAVTLCPFSSNVVMFGAPEAQPRPCDAAFAAAGQILAAVDRLNVHEIVPCAVPAVQVTMGLAFGDVVFGDVGSAERKDYTALGDAVNVAARLQELAKRLDFPVLMTESFARQLSTAAGDLHALGTHELKGHTPVAICGWKGPHPASAASQGEWSGKARTFAADG